MKKKIFCLKILIWYFSVQKSLIYYTFNKSHFNSFILLVFPHNGEIQICGEFYISYSIMSDCQGLDQCINYNCPSCPLLGFYLHLEIMFLDVFICLSVCLTLFHII